MRIQRSFWGRQRHHRQRASRCPRYYGWCFQCHWDLCHDGCRCNGGLYQFWHGGERLVQHDGLFRLRLDGEPLLLLDGARRLQQVDFLLLWLDGESLLLQLQRLQVDGFLRRELFWQNKFVQCQRLQEIPISKSQLMYCVCFLLRWVDG